MQFLIVDHPQPYELVCVQIFIHKTRYSVCKQTVHTHKTVTGKSTLTIILTYMYWSLCCHMHSCLSQVNALTAQDYGGSGAGKNTYHKGTIVCKYLVQ